MARCEPTGLGADPQVSTTVAMATWRPCPRQVSAALRMSSSAPTMRPLRMRCARPYIGVRRGRAQWRRTAPDGRSAGLAAPPDLSPTGARVKLSTVDRTPPLRHHTREGASRMNMASAEALKITSLSEAVRERLMRAIARGDLKPGARLNEAQMAQTLGVSRGPIREAARELEGQGFLVSRPNQGFYVVDFAPADIRDVYEAKDWLEAAFVADLARSLDALERRKILAEIDALDGSDRLAFTEALFAFRLRVL